MTTIEIYHFKKGKRKLISLPVQNATDRAVLYESDFDDLMQLGISPKWKLNHNQVLVRSGGKDIVIARLIRGASPKQKVVSLDDSPFNLRRENLVISPGSSKIKARDYIVRAYKQRLDIKHTYLKQKDQTDECRTNSR